LGAAFQKPLAGMVIRGAGPNLILEFMHSRPHTGFPDPDLFDHFPIQIIAFLSPLPTSALREFVDQAAVAVAGFRKSSFLVSIAQIMRAILLANVIATSIPGLRALSRASHDSWAIVFRPNQFRRDIAPIINNRRISA
jgi:hypothetical protein